MGSPELPDPGDEDLRPTEPIQPIISDESDNESVDIEYLGYQPLSTESRIDNADFEDHEESAEEATPNLEPIERAEVEITRQLWNAPRSDENQIQLDEERTAQILSAMANFTLPNTTIPAWAMEEHWKEELLQRIRQRKELETNETQKTSNDVH